MTFFRGNKQGEKKENEQLMMLNVFDRFERTKKTLCMHFHVFRSLSRFHLLYVRFRVIR